MTTLIETRRPGSFLLRELDGTGSRDNLVVAANQTLVPGQVLGRRAVLATAAAVAAIVAGSAGDGAITMDPAAPVRSDAEVGVYQVQFTGGGATAPFQVVSPRGAVVGTGAVGTPFAGPIKFAVADDAAKHYAAGDKINVKVTIGQFEHAALNPAATDGSQNAVAVALYPCVTGATQGAVAGVTRDAEVTGAILTWPAGIAAADLAVGTAQLASRSIVVR